MARRKAKRDWRHQWANEVDIARRIVEPIGCTVEMATGDYEIAWVRAPGVQLLIYPHTTKGTGNQSARVRDASSKDRLAASIVAIALFNGIGLPEADARRVRFSNMFHVNNKPMDFRRFEARGDDDDESFADRAVQASIDRAMGVPNPDADWLLP